MRLASHTLLLLSAVLVSGYGLSAKAAEDGSLDSMWVDNASPAVTPTKSAPAVIEDKPAVAAPKTQTTSAPLVTLDSFRASALVSKGGWPGVGPFKQQGSEPTLLVDDIGNKIKLELEGQQVARAELSLVDRKQRAVQTDLLDMQMNVDFLLQALGVKSGKIADLNQELDKNKELIFRPERSNPLNLTTGRLLVSIEKRRSDSGSGFDYNIAVNSLDANRTVIKEHSIGEDAKKPAVAVAPPATPDQTEPDTSVMNTPPPITMSAKPAVDKPSDTLKEELATVIKNWQRIKKSVLKTRQTAELQTALGGRALALQLNAIKWLTDNHRYYDMTPKNVLVDQVTELLPGKKYVVLAEVQEGTKYMDEATHQTLKDTNDAYKVKYTLEKSGSKWLITDSALANPAKADNGKKTH